MAENDRDLDVVVFGATGVTGRQVAKYLSDTDARWGAAGRDPAKLERTLADVGARPTETIPAELSDAGSLAAVGARPGGSPPGAGDCSRMGVLRRRRRSPPSSPTRARSPRWPAARGSCST